MILHSLDESSTKDRQRRIGKNIDEKVGLLKNSRFIDKDRKDEVRSLTFTTKKARDLISHNVKIYSSSDDGMILLENAVKLAKIHTEFLRSKRDKGDGRGLKERGS